MLVHNCGLKRSLHSLFLAVLLISLIFACTAEYSHNDNDDEDEDFEVNLLEMEVRLTSSVPSTSSIPFTHLRI